MTKTKKLICTLMGHKFLKTTLARHIQRFTSMEKRSHFRHCTRCGHDTYSHVEFV